MDKMYSILFVLQVMVRQIVLSGYSSYFTIKGGSAFTLSPNPMTYSEVTITSGSAWESFKRDVVQILNSNQYGVTYRVTNCQARYNTLDSIEIVAGYKGTEYKLRIDLNTSPFRTITVTSVIDPYDCDTLVTDKISAICSQNICSHITDLYDLYVLSQIRQYSLSSLVNLIKKKRPEFFSSGVNMLVLQNYISLEQVYYHKCGILNKPSFDIVFKICSSFIVPFFNLGTINRNLYWNGEYWL